MSGTVQIGGGLAGLLVLGVVCLAQRQAGHPAIPRVEGGTGVDFSTCAVCHADKSSGPVVHPAIELGCEGCHEVDQDEDWTEVFLATKGNDLCFACHGDKQPQPSQLSLHAPVRTGPCVECHDPHTSQTAGLLRRATESRQPTENLCLGCHADVATQIGKPTEHMAVDLGCATCHTTHKSDPADQPQGTFHLVSAEPELCLTCHDGEDADLAKAHLNQPFATARCTECHNPHGSERAKLLNNYAHSPFEEKLCELCHEEPKEGKVALVEGARRDLCLTCHADMQERLDQAKLTHAALASEQGCTACHSPHAATYPHQVRRGPVRTCFSCHTELAKAQANMPFLHKPVYEAACTACHQPHTGEREKLLRAETNALCLECHNQSMERTLRPLRRAGAPVRLFNDSVEVPVSIFENLKTIPLQIGDTAGHPITRLVKHPVSGRYPLGDNMSCVTCHQPHAAATTASLLAIREGEEKICTKCH